MVEIVKIVKSIKWAILLQKPYTFVYPFGEILFQEYIVEISLILSSTVGWLVGCIENLRRFSNILAISRLGSRR